LCTLKHAFSADNLLGLVYKIVQGKYEPIPEIYSKDLNSLIPWILNKDESKRPSVAQILKQDLVKSYMEKFVDSNG
jgi:NIMA (never in mitosis gene a)-related kinase